VFDKSVKNMDITSKKKICRTGKDKGIPLILWVWRFRMHGEQKLKYNQDE